MILPSPAKVNLLLAVHGRRADGFHELTSVVAPLEFGDRLSLLRREGSDRLQCSGVSVPQGPENLVLKAAAAFRARLGQPVFFDFELAKRIPVGAGLGGGSGNASTALKGMNHLLGAPLSEGTLLEIAAELGADCPFFLTAEPAVMRGRGERLNPVSTDQAEKLRGQRLALFRPWFGVDTAWAYRQLAARAPECYSEAGEAQEKIVAWENGGPLSGLLANAFETPVGDKYLAISTLLERLRAMGVTCLMSGSGSCCFALLDTSGPEVGEIRAVVQEAWGDSFFWVETSIA